MTEIPDSKKSLLQKQRPSMKKIFSRPKKSLEGKFSADGLPKSPSGRLTKYFSGKLYLTCNKIFTKFHNHQKFHFITLPLAFIAWRKKIYLEQQTFLLTPKFLKTKCFSSIFQSLKNFKLPQTDKLFLRNSNQYRYNPTHIIEDSNICRALAI